MNEDIMLMKSNTKERKFDLFSCLSSFSLNSNEGLFATTAVRKTIIDNTFLAGNTYPKFINEFWTSKQRQASSLHEISYRACFKPQLPRFFIERLTTVGESVYDPFMGRGTTVIESALMGRNPIGCDINPLSKMLVSPRLSPPNVEEVDQRLREINLENETEIKDDLLVFYHPVTLSQISNLRDYFINKESDNNLDDIDGWIRMVATNRLTGHSPGFFSVYTLPPNQSVSIESQMKINEKRNQVPPVRDVKKLISLKTKYLLEKLTEN